MDSEGIWKAWTAKVITNTAMTTVTNKDCIEPDQSEGDAFFDGPEAALGSDKVGTSTGGAGERASENSLCSPDSGAPAPVTTVFSVSIFPPSPIGLTINIPGPGEPPLARRLSWWLRRRGRQTREHPELRRHAAGLPP